MTCRVTRSCTGRSGSNCFTQGPADTITLSASMASRPDRQAHAIGDAARSSPPSFRSGSPRRRPARAQAAPRSPARPRRIRRRAAPRRRSRRGIAEGRKPFHQSRRVQHFVRQAVRARCEQRARHDRAVRRADLGDAGDVQELPAARRLELAPQLVGAAQERHVGRMLEIAEPDDARLAVRGAPVVAGRKALDADHARAAARESARAPRCPCAEADDRYVVFRHLSVFSGGVPLMID